MATNEQGEAVLCRGCSESGNYLGPVTAETEWDIVVASEGGGVAFVATDRNGATTEEILIPENPSIDVSDFMHAARQLPKDGILCQRISACEKGELAPVICPAIGSQALKQMLLERTISTLD